MGGFSGRSGRTLTIPYWWTLPALDLESSVKSRMFVISGQMIFLRLPVVQTALLDNAARYVAPRRCAGLLHLYDSAGGKPERCGCLSIRAPGISERTPFRLPEPVGANGRTTDSLAAAPSDGWLLHLPHETGRGSYDRFKITDAGGTDSKLSRTMGEPAFRGKQVFTWLLSRCLLPLMR